MRQRFLAQPHLRVGQFLNFFKHFLSTDAGWQLCHHQLPLAPRQFFNLPARAYFQGAATGTKSVCDLGGTADDLPTAGIVWTRNQREQLFVREIRRLDQRHAGGSDFSQVVTRYLGGQANCNAACAVEQYKWQTPRKLYRLFGGPVVIGCEVDRAFVNFVQQQAGYLRQPGLGVTHGRSAIAITATKVSLPVYQRIPLRKVLRHTHQSVVSGLIAMRMETS